jgi:hypothetical protein
MGDGLSALEEMDDDGSVVVMAELNAAERSTAGSEAAQDMQVLLGSFVVVGAYYLINIVAVVLYCKQQVSHAHARTHAHHARTHARTTAHAR